MIVVIHCVLLNLLNELRKRDKMRGFHGVISLPNATIYDFSV